MSTLSARGEYSITTDKTRFDIEAIHAFLAQSYWSPGIPISVVERAISNSLCFGLFDGDRQIGFARMITDRATFAYLADVYIAEPYRGKGLAKWLLETIHSFDDLQGLRRIMLATRDAHELYKQFGYTELADPSRLMERHNPTVYSLDTERAR